MFYTVEIVRKTGISIQTVSTVGEANSIWKALEREFAQGLIVSAKLMLESGREIKKL